MTTEKDLNDELVEEVEATEEIEPTELDEDVDGFLMSEEESDEAAAFAELQEVVEEEPLNAAEMEALTEGTELEAYESGEIEEVEFLEFDQVLSILESMLFASDRPQSLNTLKQAFRGTNVKTPLLRKALDQLAVEYASANRGVSLHEINGGYQLRTKVDNMKFLRQLVKARPFKLSGAALEVLSIIAYKQPITKFQVDEIRGVDSGHLVRGLMERNLVHFEGKSELPGKPMLYGTTRKFLEIFGLRNIKELPSLSEIDSLIPEGIGAEEKKDPKLEELTEQLSQNVGSSYSEGEEELLSITNKLAEIETTTNFFEEEKRKEKERQEAERARNIREALLVGEEVPEKDKRWLKRYEEALIAATVPAVESATAVEASPGNEVVTEAAVEVVSETTLVEVETQEIVDAAMEAEVGASDAIEAAPQEAEKETVSQASTEATENENTAVDQAIAAAAKAFDEWSR